MRRQLPRRIKIGAHVYSVVRPVTPKLDGQKLDGLCEPSELRLTIRKGLKRSAAQETTVHEIFHAFTTGIDAPVKIEEKIVDAIAKGFLLVIKDNPELIFYLQS